MSSSVFLWFSAAVLLFWAVGAYNRLVRLRSQGIAAFTVLEGLLNQFAPLAGSDAPDLDALAACADQFRVALKMCRSQPLHGPAIAALTMTYETMCLCWSRQRQLAPVRGLPALPQRWDQLVAQTEMARSEFNGAVARYNAAVNQFPAVLLARLFGFRPAQSM
ncbi:MAG: LemA family protein [Comamonadaceae bacterium]|jgi:LemA protein